MARLFTVMGVVGLAFFIVVQVMVFVDAALPPYIGALERVAVYPFQISEVAAGIGLLVESSRLRRRNLAVAQFAESGGGRAA
jgi:uncharacterized membrane protein